MLAGLKNEEMPIGVRDAREYPMLLINQYNEEDRENAYKFGASEDSTNASNFSERSKTEGCMTGVVLPMPDMESMHACTNLSQERCYFSIPMNWEMSVFR